jgi:hypothetical protein
MAGETRVDGVDFMGFYNVDVASLRRYGAGVERDGLSLGRLLSSDSLPDSRLVVCDGSLLILW